jgi:hypothetical protein
VGLSGEEGSQQTEKSEDERPSAGAVVNQGTEDATQDISTQADASTEPHGIYRWSLVLSMSWFVFGLLACIGHHKFYSHSDGILAGTSNEQEWNLRFEPCLKKSSLKLIVYRIGSIFALAVKLFQRSAVWIAYTQFLWKTLKGTPNRTPNGTPISISGLDAALSVQNSLSALVNVEMIRILKLGAVLALIAW